MRKRGKNRAFADKYWREKGKCARGEEIKGNARTCRGQEIDMTGKQGGMKGKQRENERDMKGKDMKTGGVRGE